jgi:sterol desaturase/sphingolipid hydroxylase (fatty acid hydroxylase superfamily)
MIDALPDAGSAGFEGLEPWIRAGVFVGVIVVLFVAQRRWPRRERRPWREAASNVFLFVTNTALVRLLSVTSLLGASLYAESRGVGLLNVAGLPAPVAVLTAVVALDFGMYVQHRLFHWVPWLWRFHAVHHSDVWFDFTTGIRFHPVEMIVSLFFKMAFVLALGAAPLAVVIFEVLLSTGSLFAHSNLRLPLAADWRLRRAIVTPDMHRIHHSTLPHEHNQNFGFLISWWDRWLGSYAPEPDAGHQAMTIGLDAYRGHSEQSYPGLLGQPFKPGQF